MHHYLLGRIVLALTIMTTPCWGQQVSPEGALSLAQALELTLKQSPELAVYSWDTRIAEARRLQAGLRPNPELSLEVEELRFSDGPKTITTSGTDQEIEDGASGGFGQAEFTLSLSQLIELGGKRMKRIRAAEFEGDVFQREYEIARADVLAEVAILFVEVLGAQERVRLANETLTLSMDVAKAIAARVTAGQVSPIEETRATVQSNQAQIEVQHEARKLEASRYRLASMWGSNVPTFTKALGTLDETGDILSVEQLKTQVAQSPDLKYWTAELNRRDALVALERAQGKPDVGVTIGYRSQELDSYNTSTFDLGTPPTLLGQSRSGFDEGRSESFVVGVSIPLPLFNRNQGAIKEAEYQVKKASMQRRAKEVRMHALLDVAHEMLQASISEVKSLRVEVLPRAKSAYDATNQGYIAGKFGYLDVLDAQRTLVSARSQYLDSLIEYHQARARLERLAGIDISQKSNVDTPETQGVK